MPVFKNITKVTGRELKRIRGNMLYPLLMIILPVLSFMFFAAIFSEGTPHDMAIAVMDNDKTPTSRTLLSMLDHTPSAAVKYNIQDMDEGERMIRSGEISAIVYIPENFEKDILSNTQTNVTAYISGLNITANGLLSKDLQTAANTFSAGIQLQLLMKKGLSEKQAYAQLMPVHFDKHVLFNPYTNYSYYLLPSFMPMMLMVFSLLLTIYAIGSELREGSAGEWFRIAGGNPWIALTGKLLPHTSAMFLMSIFMNTVMYKWVGVPLNGSPGILTLAAFMLILAYQAIGILIISVLSNLRLSLSIGGGYSVLAFTFSGLTFPLIAMDNILRISAYIYPFTFYTEIFVDQAMRGAPVIYSIPYSGWMLLFIFLPVLCVNRLKTISTNEKYWHRL